LFLWGKCRWPASRSRAKFRQCIVFLNFKAKLCEDCLLCLHITGSRHAFHLPNPSWASVSISNEKDRKGYQSHGWEKGQELERKKKGKMESTSVFPAVSTTGREVRTECRTPRRSFHVPCSRTCCHPPPTLQPSACVGPEDLFVLAYTPPSHFLPAAPKSELAQQSLGANSIFGSSSSLTTKYNSPQLSNVICDRPSQ
jgi:hypothetical protein